MDMRGKAQVDIFGPETIDEIDAQIRRHANDLGVEVEIYQSNDEDQVVDMLAVLDPDAFAALLINPGGFTTTTGSLPEAIGRLDFPAYEVHASNPSARGVRSTLQPVCRGSICGFGYDGYRLGLLAIKGAPRTSD